MNHNATTLTTLAEQLKPYVAAQVRAHVGRTLFQQSSVSATAGGTDSHPPVTALGTSLAVGLAQEVSVRLATDSGLEVVEGLRLGTPGGLGATSQNAVSGSAHTHAIATAAPGTIQPDATASAGSAAELARADHRHAITCAAPISVSLAANGEGSVTTFTRSDHQHQLDQTITPTWSGLHTHTANVNLAATATLSAHDWASGVRGWGIQHDGTADFRILTADELVVKAFIADLEQALAGGQIIPKSVVLLGADFLIPDYGMATQITVEPLPGFPDADVFANGDHLRARYIGRTAGLEVTDCWMAVGSQVSKDASAQVWNVTRLAAGAGGLATPGNVVHRGAIVLDYGQSGDGYWEVTALDQNSGPYAQIVTWETTPTNRTVRARLGQLSGMAFASGDEWGLFAGDLAGGNYVRASTAGLHIHAGGGSHRFDEHGLTIYESGDTYLYRYYDQNDPRRLVSEDYVRLVGEGHSINRTIVVRNNGYDHATILLRSEDQVTGRAFSELWLGGTEAHLYGAELKLGYTDHNQQAPDQDRLLISKTAGVRVYYTGLAVGSDVSATSDGWAVVKHGIIPTSTLTGTLGTADKVWNEGYFGALHATTVSYTTVTSESQTITGDMDAGNGTLVVKASTHRVGINKAEPLSALDVTGDGRFSGVLYAEGGLTLAGNLTITTGTIDGVDLAALKASYDAHAHGAGDPTQVSHANLSGVSANQHHNQAHTLSGADHTAAGLTVGHVLRAAGASSFAWAQLGHADLGGVSANQHHNQAHVLAGADHTASGLTTGWVLRASGASAFAWAQLGHGDLGGITAEQHHAMVTAGNTAIGVAGQAVSLALATDAGLEIVSGLQMGTPDTIEAGDTNAVSGTTHRHAVSTGAPGSVSLAANAEGSATSLARSDHRHALDQGVVPTWTGEHTHAGNVLLGAAATLKSATWASGTTGWGITPAGAADFRRVTAGEIVAQAFVADIEQALAAGQTITKSVVLLAADWTIPAYSGATTVAVEPLPGYPLVDVFTTGGILRLRTISRSAGLEVADCYVQVGSQVSKDATSQVWNVTRLAGPAGGAATAGSIVHRGAVALDYGVSGDGYWEVTCLDQVAGPYAQIATWTTTPANATVRARIGQLSGIFGEGSEWGLFAGDHAAGNYLRASDLGLGLHVGDGNVTLDEDGITVSGEQVEQNFQTGVRWTDSLSHEIGKVSAGLWYGGNMPEMRLSVNGGGDFSTGALRLTATGEAAGVYTRLDMNASYGYARSFLYAQNGSSASHSALLCVASDYVSQGWPAQIEMRVDNTVLFELTTTDLAVNTSLRLPLDANIWFRAAGTSGDTGDRLRIHYSSSTHQGYIDCYGTLNFRGGTTSSAVLATLTTAGNFTVTGNITGGNVTSGSDPGHTHTSLGSLTLTGNLTQNNSATLVAKNSTGGSETWMWPRYSDNWMYTNFGASGWRIRTNASGGALTFDGSGNATFHVSVAGPNITSGTDPGHTHTAYSANSHNHDHGALTGRADDDHTQYLLASGARALSANWDAGSYQIRALTFYSDVATGTAPFTVASTTTVTNLSANYLQGNLASAFATSGHTHSTLGALTSSGEIRASYSGAKVSANTTSGGGNPGFIMYENGTYRHGLEYSTSGNKFYWWHGPLATTCWEILDSGTDIRANTNWYSNAFDWVCGVCGWHGPDRPAGDQCPACGGLVEWHDDAALLHLAVHQPGGVALDRMEKLGVLSRHEDGQVFMALQTAHMLSWSAIAQLWVRLRAAEARVAALEGGL